MKKLCILLMIPLLAACSGSDRISGSGKIASEKRQVGDFKGISLSGRGTLSIKQGYKTAVVVETDDNLLDFIESVVQDGILYLREKSGSGKTLLPSKEIFYTVTVRDLEKLDISGASTVKTLEEILGDRLRVDVNGAARLDLDIEMEQLELFLSGASKIRIAGDAPSQVVVITGAAAYDGSRLNSKEAAIELSGSGSAVVNVSGKLSSTISGAGSVKYKGDPELETEISGSGSVTKIK